MVQPRLRSNGRSSEFLKLTVGCGPTHIGVQVESSSECPDLFWVFWAPPKGAPITSHYFSLDTALNTPCESHVADSDFISDCRKCSKVCSAPALYKQACIVINKDVNTLFEKWLCKCYLTSWFTNLADKEGERGEGCEESGSVWERI